MARIYPVVLFSIGIAVLSLPYGLSHPDLLENWYSLRENWETWLGLSLIAQLLMLTGWLPAARLNQPWNSPSWSVSCEVFFYLVFPALVKTIRPLKSKGLVITGVVAFLMQGLMLIAISNLPNSGARGFLVSQFPITHFAEFILGVVAAKICQIHGPAIFSSTKRVIYIQVLTVAAIVTLSISRPIEPAYYLLSPLFAVLIMSFAQVRGINVGLDSRIMVLLGESSYALYMTHIPLVHFWEVLNKSVGLPNYLFIPAAIGLSVLTYSFLEKPTRKAIVAKYQNKIRKMNL